MRVKLKHDHPYYLNGQFHQGKPGEIVELPEYMALGCVAAGHGQMIPEKGKPLASPTNKIASPDVTKDDDEPESCDFTVLPKIGEKNAATIVAEGINTYAQLWSFMQSEQGRAFLIGLPRIQASHLPEIENALMSIVLVDGE